MARSTYSPSPSGTASATADHPATPSDPILHYDAERCAEWVKRWRTRTGDRVRYEPMPPLPLYARTRADAAAAVRLELPDGRSWTGAGAVCLLWLLAGQHRWPWLTYRRFNSCANVAEWLFREIVIRPPSYGRSDWVLTRNLLVRGMAFIYLLALASYWHQADGLIGDQGIMPARETLSHGEWWQHPSLLALAPGDLARHALTILGAALAVALAAGWRPRVAAFGLWVTYLSLMHAGGQFFFGYGWDANMLEAGFLLILLAPRRSCIGWRGCTEPPPFAALLLWQWLAFRTFVENAATRSIYQVWSEGTGLALRLTGQPLPTPVSWWLAQEPASWLKLITQGWSLAWFVLPFALLAPRQIRAAAGVVLLALEIFIGFATNFGWIFYIHLLMVVPFFDDRALGGAWALVSRLWPRALRRESTPAPAPILPRLRFDWLPWAGLGFLMLVTVIQSIGFLEQIGRPLPASIARAAAWVRPWCFVNNQFSATRLPPERMDYIVEGSRDGVEWRAYTVPFQPTGPDWRPRFIFFGHPRLASQLWIYATLRGPDATPPPWMQTMGERLIEGAPSVRGLFEVDPFADGPPPKWVRVRHVIALFTSARRPWKGQWWDWREGEPQLIASDEGVPAPPLIRD